MTSSDAPAGRSHRRRTVVIVSLIAIVILGVIGTSLVMLSGSSANNVTTGVPSNTGNGDITQFRDPQGTYTLQIDPHWRATHNAASPDVESWFTGTGTVDFQDNVNILSQRVAEVDLDQYMQLVIDEAQKSVDKYALKEFRVVTTNPLTGTTSKTPTQLGVIAYTGNRGGKSFGFFFVASIEHGDAVLATLTTAQDRFDKVRAKVEPYLMTLRQT
jgi:hypothetical protein